MTTSATLVQLAAELTLFVVALAGAGLSVRSGLLGLDRTARLLLAGGFVVLAGTALAVGALIVERTADPVALAAVRSAGAVIVAMGALRWAGSRVARPTLLVGLGVLVVAAVAEARGLDVGADGVGAEPLVLVAALIVGAALVVAGRHTIPGRIGTSVAGILLGVVLLVSFGLSAVVSRTVEDEALARYGDRAAVEAAAARDEAGAARDEATLVAAGLTAGLGSELVVLGDPQAPPDDRDAARAEVDAALADLGSALDVGAPIVVVGADGAPIAASPSDLGQATRLSLAGDPVVQEALEVDGARQGVTVVGEDAYAVAAVPTRAARDGDAVAAGVVVVARRLDDAYLRRRLALDSEPLSVVLTTRDAVAARSGDDAPPVADVVGPGRTVIDEGADQGELTDARVLVARPLAADGAAPQLAVVLSTPSDQVVRTREDLYRSLFLVAMVAGLLGMALAILVGERIGGAIRRLTAAAARIREGDLSARASVDREDELGELSTTFDAMAASVHHLTDDLRDAAAEEGRLRARLESVFAGVTEAVVAADPERRVTDVNLAAADLLGLDDGRDAIGRRLDEVVDVRGLDGHPLSLSAPRQRPRLVAGRVCRRAPADGVTSVPVVGTVASLHGPGGVRAGLVVVLRDVRREQALEAAKQDFLANIGHELRTPLTPIKGYAGVLRRRPPTPEEARDWADGIAVGVDRLEHVVDRLVTFAAVTAGPGAEAAATSEELDPRALLDAVVAEWRPRLGADRELELAVVADGDDGLPTVRGDAAQLRLAVGELIDNASRFSSPGTPVRLAVRGADEGGAVAFVVADEGGGDGPALDAVVDAFVQGESSATRTHGGLGLGLALADRVARAHGGRVELDSSPDGTIVSILVPVVTPGPHPTGHGAAP